MFLQHILELPFHKSVEALNGNAVACVAPFFAGSGPADREQLPAGLLYLLEEIGPEIRPVLSLALKE